MPLSASTQIGQPRIEPVYRGGLAGNSVGKIANPLSKSGEIVRW